MVKTFIMAIPILGFIGTVIGISSAVSNFSGSLDQVFVELELDPKTVRSLLEIIDPEPLLPPHLFHLADFVTSYYRSPLGDTLATVLPAGLLRSDGEVARLTPAGAAADPETLPGKRGAVLSELQAATKLRLPTLFSRAGVAGRGPLDALVDGVLECVRLRPLDALGHRRSRRQRPRPEVDLRSFERRSCRLGSPLDPPLGGDASDHDHYDERRHRAHIPSTSGDRRHQAFPSFENSTLALMIRRCRLKDSADAVTKLGIRHRAS